MLMERLENGSLVHLEFVTQDDNRYEMLSRVTGTSKNSLLVEPVKKDKHIDSLNSRESKHMICNLYANDPDGKRVGWHNVGVKTIDYKNHSYRGIFTKCFNQDSTPSDRRNNARLRLEGLTAQVESGDGNRQEVALYDISNNGISFISDTEFYPNQRILIHLEDKVNEEFFQMDVKCTCVRTKQGTDGILYGCNIREENMRFLMYLFQKRLSQKWTAEKRKIDTFSSE